MPSALAASISFTAPPRSIVRLRSAPLPGPAPAAKTTASTPRDRRADVVLALEVADHRLDPDRVQVVFLGGVADQAEDGVPLRDQQLAEQQPDLAVAAGDRDLDLHHPSALSSSAIRSSRSSGRTNISTFCPGPGCGQSAFGRSQ